MPKDQAKKKDKTRELLLEIYRRLLDHFGHLQWWPGTTRFEIMVGAILTQNTAWTNVEKAIANLDRENLLTPDALAQVDIRKLRTLIRPSGYYNQKAKKLKGFVEFLLDGPYKGSIESMIRADTQTLRAQLLDVWGIGPETADSMLHYALDHPLFVVDAYTRRAFARLGILPQDADYQMTQQLFMEHLPADLSLYNDYHAQIVWLGKEFCRPKPKCDDCPLNELCTEPKKTKKGNAPKDER